MFRILRVAAIGAAMIAGPASAAISLGPNVNGIATFSDSTTGRNWARMDSYFNATYNSMSADLTRRGFTLATRSDVEALFASVDVVSNFAGVAAIMGDAPNRNLIWGAYVPLNSQTGNVNWGFARDVGGWQFDVFTSVGPNDVPNAGSNIADMNFWAYVSGGTGGVPEPSSWAMLIAGFGLVGAVARRRRVVAA